MWNIDGRQISPERFQPFEPREVLYEFDGPRIFSFPDFEGELNLAYWSDEDEDVWRYVVVPTTTRILKALASGAISVYDALNQPRCWLCDVGPDQKFTQCQQVDFEAIPRDCLPAAGTMLLQALEPVASLPQVIDLEGRIRELDKDRLSFDL